MKIIGLTGSIAAGKSTAAGMFSLAGIAVHDADRCVHRILGPQGAAVSLVADHFGAHLKLPDGSIDRPVLGRIVFGDEQARRALEAVLHPMVRKDRDRFLTQMTARRQKLAVLDVPLLFESRTDAICDYVVTVWAPLFLLRRRALARPHMTEQKWQQIITSQMPQSEKMRLSDLALPTALGKADTRRRLLKWLAQIRSS